MTKEQIKVLETLFERRKEIQSFIDCDSDICRLQFPNDLSDDTSFDWDMVKMIHAEDFKQEVISLAERYIKSIDEQIENVIKVT